MSKVAIIYTASALVEPMKKIFTEYLPGCQMKHIVEDSMIGDVIAAGKPTNDVIRRMIYYFMAAEASGADVILNTCSSVGEIVDIGRKIVNIPIVKIDEAMAAEAVKQSNTIGVVATLQTTLGPTVRLVQSQAAAVGKSVTVVEGLAEGAFQAMIAGNPEEHNRLIIGAAEKVAKKVDTIVLAQGSMAAMEEDLRKRTGKLVLSSPKLGALAVKAILDKKA